MTSCARLRLALGAALVAAVLGGSGCVAVQPYERETLARSDMQFDSNPAVSASEQHATEVREGASGGFGGGGGGCGCN